MSFPRIWRQPLLLEGFQSGPSPSPSTSPSELARSALNTFFPVWNAFPFTKGSDISGVIGPWVTKNLVTATSPYTGSALASSSYSLSFSYSNTAESTSIVFTNIILNDTINISGSLSATINVGAKSCAEYGCTGREFGYCMNRWVDVKYNSSDNTCRATCDTWPPSYSTLSASCIRYTYATVTGTATLSITSGIPASTIVNKISANFVYSNGSSATITINSTNYTSSFSITNPDITNITNDFTKIYVALLIDLYTNLISRHGITIPSPPTNTTTDRSNAMAGTNVATLQSNYIGYLQAAYTLIYNQVNSIINAFNSYFSLMPAATRTAAPFTSITSAQIATDLSGFQGVSTTAPSDSTLATNLITLTNIYNTYNSAHSTLLSNVKSTFTSLYTSARMYINSTEFTAATNALYRTLLGTSTFTVDQVTAYYRDILGLVANRYWLIRNASNPLITVSNAISAETWPREPTSSYTADIPDAMTFSQLQSLQTKYLDASSGLWPTYVKNSTTGLSKLVENFIVSYRDNASTAGVTVDISASNVDISGTNIDTAFLLSNAVYYGRSTNAQPWSAMSSALTIGDAIAVGPDNKVYAYGYKSFSASGPIMTTIAVWDNSSWSTLPMQLNNDITKIVISTNGTIYACGRFTFTSNSFNNVTAMNRIARWNPTASAWSSLGTGLNGDCLAMVIGNDGNIYVGGEFTTAGGNSASRIAMWNPTTSTWSALGTGLNNTCRALAVAPNGNIYACGNFTTAGDSAANNVAMWIPSTSTWSSIGGTGIGTTHQCNDLVVDSNGILYMAGSFASVNGVDAIRIARWNPSTSAWSALGTGLNGPSRVLSIGLDNNVYVGGSFTSTGRSGVMRLESDISANNIAIWNPTTSTWSAIGTGLNNICNALAIGNDGTLYAGGDFTTAGGVTVKSITQYNAFKYLGNSATFIHALNSIYLKYKALNDGILTGLRNTAKSARTAYDTLKTNLGNCTLSTIPTTVSTANTDYAGDVANIDAAQTNTAINAFTTKYNNAASDYFTQVVSDQRTVFSKYKNFYTKYNTFATDTNVPKYGVTLETLPTTLPNPATDPLAGITTRTATTVETLGTFCTNYNTPTSGFYNALISFVRIELSKYIVAFDNLWNALDTTVKAGTTYTSPIPAGSTSIPTSVSDELLYDYMNAYAGYVRDSLTASGPSVSSSPAPSGFRTTLSSAQTQYYAIINITDFLSIYTQLQQIIESSTVPTDVAALYQRVSTIAANPNQNLNLAVETVSAITYISTFNTLISHVQTRMNALLTEYADLYSVYSTMQSDLSGVYGVYGIPTLDSLTVTAPTWNGTSPLSGFAYSQPSGNSYTLKDLGTTANPFTIYGSLANWSDPSGVSSFLPFLNKFQSLVSSCQLNINTFRNTLSSSISSLPSISINSTTSDTLGSSDTNSKTLRNSIDRLGKVMTIWYMRNLIIHTYNPGIRFLSANDVSNEVLEIIQKCQRYIYDGTSERLSATTSSVTYMNEDRAGTVISASINTTRSITTALAKKYQSAWTTWVTSGRISMLSDATPNGAKMQTANDDTETTRVLYLEEWPKLMTDIKNATASYLRLTKDISEWKTMDKIIKGVVTTKLGM